MNHYYSKIQGWFNFQQVYSMVADVIDGSHLYENVKKDIKLYLPKIKNGGIITGHDWQCDDARKAVMEFFDMSHINLIHNTWLIKIENNL